MKTVIIVHGWDGSSKKDWMPWAKEALEKTGVKVVMPDMPHSEKPEIGECVQYLSSVVGAPDEDTYFVGHSIGCQTILRYLETINTPVGGAVFVAGWFNLENLEDEETKEIAKPWIETPIDLKKVRAVLPKSTMIISDNDPYDCFEENKKKFAELRSKIIVLPNAGHITSEDGFLEFPEVLFALNTIS